MSWRTWLWDAVHGDEWLQPVPKGNSKEIEYGSGSDEECLAQARGALSDIAGLVTDCVPKDAPPQMHELCESVLGRILSSGDRRRSRPSWFRHEWERKLWERYESGEIKACAYPKIAAKDFAQMR